MITAEQFKLIFSHADADAWAPAISEAWRKFGFTTVNAKAGFLGICGNETGGFRQVRREIMTHTLDQAKTAWTRARNDPETCQRKINLGPQPFANWIYAGRNGNGDEASGDGWRFRGGGIIQLTGRTNYKACGAALGIDLLKDPDAVCRDPATSAAAAAWFMADYAKILPDLDKPGETSFLAAALKVGLPANAATTANRLKFRREALDTLTKFQPPPEPPRVVEPAAPARGSGTWLEWLVRFLGRKSA